MNLIEEIKPGAAVSVSYLDQIHKPNKAAMTYVGLVDNDYLILKFAATNRSAPDLHGLKAGTQLSVNTLIGNASLSALHFQSSSFGVSKLREPVLLVGYPKKVKGQKLRNAPRIAVELMAEMQISGCKDTVLVLITDFSQSGLRCEFVNEFKPELEPLNKESEVVIHLLQSEELGQDIVLKGIVKNIKWREKVYLGVAFNTEQNSVAKTVFTTLMMGHYGL